MLQQFHALRDYALYCMDSSLHAPVCHDFWLTTVVIALTLALVILSMFVRQQIRIYLEFRRNRKHLEARKIVADRETIARYTWNENSGPIEDLSEAEIAARIKQEIESRKHPSPDTR